MTDLTNRTYVDSPAEWVRDQVAAIDAAGSTDAASIMGMRVIVVHIQGAKSGQWRKVPLMRVEHMGTYAAVASRGGAPENPAWYHSLLVNPDVDVHDGESTMPMRARQLTADERGPWWDRAVAAFPQYALYQENTERQIPVFVLEPR